MHRVRVVSTVGSCWQTMKSITKQHFMKKWRLRPYNCIPSTEATTCASLSPITRMNWITVNRSLPYELNFDYIGLWCTSGEVKDFNVFVWLFDCARKVERMESSDWFCSVIALIRPKNRPGRPGTALVLYRLIWLSDQRFKFSWYSSKSLRSSLKQ